MATDYTRALVAASLANQPLLLPSGLPSVPLYVALGNGSNGGRGHQATDIGLFAEVYGTRLRYSYDSVYQAYTAQITRNYTVSQPTGTFTECAVFDQDVTQTTLTAAVSAGATSLPVASGTAPAVQGGDTPGQYTTAYIADTTNSEYVAIAVTEPAGATTWTLQSGLQFAHGSGSTVVVFTGNALLLSTFPQSQTNQAGQALTVQAAFPITAG